MKAAYNLSGFLLLAALPQLLLAQTAVTLSTSPNPAIFGAPVVLTATVSPSDATGRVTFYDGVAVLGAAPLSFGTAQLSTALLPSGIRRLKAYYGGDASHLASASNLIAQSVNVIRGGGFGAGYFTSFLGSAPDFPPVGYVSKPAIGDFNSDGKADLAFVIDGVVRILAGDGHGSFNAVTATANAPAATSIAVGDFNGDGKPDLLLVNGGSSLISVLLGIGNGAFQPAVTYAAGTADLFPRSVAMADFNGDGSIDLAVTSDSGLGVFLGNGDGTFPTAVNYRPGSSSLGLAVGDFNSDGNADLVVSDFNGLTILPGNGAGAFQPGILIPGTAANGSNEFSVADFNADGKSDILAILGSAAVLLGNGDATFRPPVVSPLSYGYSSILGDFNADGKLDLVTLGVDPVTFGKALTLLSGNGDGSFQPASSFEVGGFTLLSLAVAAGADFNGDGRADLAFSDRFVTTGPSPGHPTLTGGGIGTLLGTPVTIQVTGGTGQFAPVGSPFPAALQVTIQDGGAPVSGASITFVAPFSGPGASLSGSATAVTNGFGVASITATANGVLGAYVVEAFYQGQFVSFALTNLAGPPASITASGGTPQSTGLRTAFPDALQATVKDAFGNPVNGVAVTFAAPVVGAGAVLSSLTAVTNIFGVASVTATANSTAGSYTVTASVGAQSASFLLTNLPSGNFNLALRKAATQSSTVSGYATAGAAGAVDGNQDGNFFNGSVTHTNLDANAWWQVDLGATATVNSIVIWNRTDCCSNRLNDYWVFVSSLPFSSTDTPGTLQNRPGIFASHQTVAPNPSATIVTGGAAGRYVRVQLTFANNLSLAEVQILGTALSASSNVALGRPATQSSTLPGYATTGAAGAVDGSTDGNFFNGSVTHTNVDTNAWWQVDLGASATINSIAIWNRTDCCANRLSDYWVFVSDLPFTPADTPATLQNRAGTFSSHQTAAPNPFTAIVTSLQGRYVRVQLAGTGNLSLAEVQVLGTAGESPVSNVAVGKTAVQSSTLSGYATTGAAGAVDGNTGGNFFDGSVTHTNADLNAWWQVDLGVSAAITSVVIWNRTDPCCVSRLSDYWVFVSDTPFSPTDSLIALQNRPGTFSSHQTTAPDPFTTIAVAMQGRYVRVQLAGTGFLSLAEVQVFGQ